MAYEMAARINVFGIFGSAPLISVLRDGKVRAQGPFSHAILIGTFGGAVLPLFFGVLRGRKKRALMLVAIVSATIIAVSSGSSGPAIAWGVGVLGWALWPIRKHMRKLMWGMVGLAVVIHVIRDKPIWHLIGRLAEATGGTGYHRYLLIDAFVARFSEWAVLGSSDTAHWGWGLQDVTNQYIAHAVDGGLLTLVLFVILLRTAFVRLRGTRQLVERGDGPKSLWAQLSWGFSVSLAVHCASFISVSYFGQMEQFFYLFLAMIPALSRTRRPVHREARRRPQPAELRPSPAASRS
jgi:hypothetical protein